MLLLLESGYSACQKQTALWFPWGARSSLGAPPMEGSRQSPANGSNFASRSGTIYSVLDTLWKLDNPMFRQRIVFLAVWEWEGEGGRGVSHFKSNGEPKQGRKWGVGKRESAWQAPVLLRGSRGNYVALLSPASCCGQ